MIRVITFDLDDTLWEVAPVIHRAERVLDNWLAGNVPGLQYDVTGMRSLRHQVLDAEPELAGRITEFRARLIQLAMEESNVAEAQALSAAAIEVFLTARNQIELFPGAEEALSGLADRFTLGALSNGNADINRLGLNHLFEFAFSAEQVGAPKPQANLFLAALAHTGAQPGEMIYVGDDPLLDVDAAREVGLRTIWLNHKERSPGKHQADVEITQINQLPAAVNSIVELQT